MASVEQIKSQSAQLRGQLLDSLQDPITGALRDSDQTIIKYHGSYQQDDRDVRAARTDAKLEPEFSFMIRTRTPGGVVTPVQWLALDQVARRFATRGLRVTSRQTVQFHGVIKTDLKATMQAINESLIDTLAACGDVNRNVAVAVNPHHSPLHATVYAAAAKLSERLLPNTRAYYEIWLDEERVTGSGTEDDPIYGERYLPRKFKIGFAVPPVNDVDIYTQDLGFIAQTEHNELIGFIVTAGGGMGASHGDPQTYPLLAHTLGFIPLDALEAVAIAVIGTQRDFGNREQRKRARLKYTIEDHGLDWFKAEVERRSGVQFDAHRFSKVEFTHSGDQFGWLSDSLDATQSQLGLRIVAGRISDSDQASVQTGLAHMAELLSTQAPQAEFRLTPNQNVLIARIPIALKAQISQLLSNHGLDLHERANSVLLHAMACVALPTCGLAMAEAERYLPAFAGRLQQLLTELDLAQEPLQIRLSGCPNGCSRPYVSEVALVGKAPGRYNLMLGGSHRGERLNVLDLENADEAQILQRLRALLMRFASERHSGERFGDYLDRAQVERSARKAIPSRLAAP